MIITRTPFRISFFGGGTDYPDWYRENGGAVLSTSIDKYCYINARFWPPFFGKKYRVSYSRIELTDSISELQHPSVRACLSYLGFEDGLEITHNADLPSRSGLGSSSSFTVGLLNSLYGLRGKLISKFRLAEMAIHVEQNVIMEKVGTQDQVAAAHGGFNLITFGGNQEFSLQPVVVPRRRLAELNSHLMLFFSGISRYSTDIACENIKNIANRRSELTTMYQYVYEAAGILTSQQDIKDFGRLLHENWKLKRTLASCVSNGEIDAIYRTAMDNGAIGGKVLGAGGGGFVLIFADPENQLRIRKALGRYLHVPFKFEFGGSQTIFFSPNDSHNNGNGGDCHSY
jgi:D-glycero-alpha-D-manno-heptose-7-phosphate kinase